MMNIINDNNKSVVVNRNDSFILWKNEQTSEHNLVTQHRTQQDHRL